MKKVLVFIVASVLSMVLAVPTSAIEDNQATKETVSSFEQMKTNYLKKLDERINSLQQQKDCVQAATNQDDLKTCKSKHKAGMKEYRYKMKKRGDSGSSGSEITPQAK